MAGFRPHIKRNQHAIHNYRLRSFWRSLQQPGYAPVFSDERRIQYYLDVEGALARVQARLGIIPKEAAEEICRHCFVEQIDMVRLKKQIDVIGHPVLPVVQQLVGLCSNGMGEWCHWGTTTQDIIDTATIMQLRDALNLVEQDMTAISGSLASMAERYRDTPMAGRTKHSRPFHQLRPQDGRAAGDL